MGRNCSGQLPPFLPTLSAFFVPTLWQRRPLRASPTSTSCHLLRSEAAARGAWAQAARVDADASMSRGTAMRAARRAAEAEADDLAAEEQEEDVDELLLGCI